MYTFWQRYMLACVYHQSGGSRVAMVFSLREIVCPGQDDPRLAALRTASKHLGAVDWSCVLPVESTLVTRQGDQFLLETGDRSKYLTDEFLNSCSPEWADKLRQAIERLRSS